MDDYTIQSILTRQTRENEVKEESLRIISDTEKRMNVGAFTKAERLYILMEIESWAKTEQINELLKSNKKDKTWY
jgi:hypothetical protein